MAEDTWTRLGRGAMAAGRRLSGEVAKIDPSLLRHIAAGPVLGATQIVPAKLPVAFPPEEGRRPVVFVHGFGGHAGNFAPMIAAFRARGRRAMVSMPLAGDVGVEPLAVTLAGQIRAMIDAGDLPSGPAVDLVAHSMGGLVCRLAVDQPALSGRVANLVTLATPHNGTGIARLARTPAAMDLRAGSRIMRRLDAQLPWNGVPGRPKLLSLWSPEDLILMPPQSAHLEGVAERVIPDISHFGWLLRPRMWAMVYRALGPSSG